MVESSIFSDSPSTKERAPLSTPNKGLLAGFAGYSNSNNNGNDEGRWIDAPMCAPGVFFSKSEEGWSNYWSVKKSWHQIVSRNKTQKDHYALHAFRCWSLLIMLNSPVTTGLSLAYNDVKDWVTGSLWFNFSNFQFGVNMYLTIAGFLYFQSVSKILRESEEASLAKKNYKNFIFRGYMKLAPSIYVFLPIIIVFGFVASAWSHKAYNDFGVHCLAFSLENVLMINNFHSLLGTVGCLNQTWFFSCEFQLFIFSIPAVVLYNSNKHAGFLLVSALVIAIVLFRLLLCETVVGNSNKLFNSFANTLFFSRGDSFLMGSLLYIGYDNILKPFLTRTYSFADMRRNYGRQFVISCSDDDDDSASTQGLELLPDDAISTEAGDERVSVSWISAATTDGNNSSTSSPLEESKEVVDMTLWERYIAKPWWNNWAKKGEDYAYMKTNGPEWMTRGMKAMWILSGTFILLSTLDALFGFELLPESVFSSRYAYQTYGYFMGSGLTCALLFIALEGTFIPLKWVSEWYIWYPLSSLLLPTYLCSFLFAYLVGMTYIPSDGEKMDWKDSSSGGGIGQYFSVYMLVLILSIAGGLVLSVLVEKPFVRMSKRIVVL